ncbi:hypothetical protein WALBB_120003 [Wolbachia pipientis wAlbB]|nr:hypothetical protein WALBB_120003 [Wolbachia pipientis wAlbB]
MFCWISLAIVEFNIINTWSIESDALYYVHHSESNPGFFNNISSLVRNQKKSTLLLSNQSYLELT